MEFKNVFENIVKKRIKISGFTNWIKSKDCNQGLVLQIQQWKIKIESFVNKFTNSYFYYTLSYQLLKCFIAISVTLVDLHTDILAFLRILDAVLCNTDQHRTQHNCKRKVMSYFISEPVTIWLWPLGQEH